MRIQQNDECGFSLVELMVAMVISLILIGAAGTTYITSKKSYNHQEDLGRIQENARFALEFIKYDIRMAGYYGCADDPSSVTNHVNGGSGTLFDTSNSLRGINNATAVSTWSPDSGALGVSDIRLGTDAITISYLGSGEITISTPYMPQKSAALHTAAGNALKQGDIVAVTDCYSTDIFQISNANPDSSGTVDHNTGGSTSPGNATKPLSKTYEGDAFIRAYRAVRYYIRSDAGGGPALMRQSLTNTAGSVAAAAEELVEGIEDMQILYGEDTSGSSEPDIYRDAGSVVDWDRVRSVRISLLSSSINEYGLEKDTQTYTLLDTTFDDSSDERRRRRVFTTTVLARNL
ncbi:MAG: PilW family protein [Candidatus Sedimenticola sp. (ex Thyasira tokunagai)]